MCKCTPEIRTPFCGRGDCLPPGYANLGEWLGIFSDAEAEAAAQASLDRVWEQAVNKPTKLLKGEGSGEEAMSASGLGVVVVREPALTPGPSPDAGEGSGEEATDE
jgi:hypothetical protein